MHTFFDPRRFILVGRDIIIEILYFLSKISKDFSYLFSILILLCFSYFLLVILIK